MSDKGFRAPNYTQIPNDFFDMIPDMGEAEVKLMLVMCRNTFGYHRKKFRMSLTKLQKTTGLSRQGVINATESAEKRGLITKIKTDGVNEWVVNVVDQSTKETFKVVNVVDQMVNVVDQTSQPDRPPSIKESFKENDKKKISPFPEQQRYWDMFLQQMKMEAQKSVFDQKIKNTWVSGFSENGTGNILQIGCETDCQRDWLESRLTSTATRMLSGVFDKEIIIEFVKGEA